MRYHLTLVQMAIIKRSTKSKCWRGCGEEGTVQLLWRTVWRFLKKLKIQLPYDPAIPQLAIYLDKIVNFKRYMYPQMFTAALFPIANTRKQSESPSTNGMDKKDVVCIYKHIHNG